MMPRMFGQLIRRSENFEYLLLFIFIIFSPYSTNVRAKEGVVTINKGDNLTIISRRLNISLGEIKTKCEPKFKNPDLIPENSILDCSGFLTQRKEVEEELVEPTVIEPVVKKSEPKLKRFGFNFEKAYEENNRILFSIKDEISSGNINKQLKKISKSQDSSNEIIKNGLRAISINTEFDAKPTSLSMLISLLIGTASGLISMRIFKNDH